MKEKIPGYRDRYRPRTPNEQFPDDWIITGWFQLRTHAGVIPFVSIRHGSRGPVLRYETTLFNELFTLVSKNKKTVRKSRQ